MDGSIRAMVSRVADYMARPAPEYPPTWTGRLLSLKSPHVPLPSMPSMSRLPADYEFVGPVAPLASLPELDLVDAAIDMGGLLDVEEWFTWAPVPAPVGLSAKVQVRQQARARVLPLPKHYPRPAVVYVEPIIKLIPSVTECAAVAPAAEEFGTSDAMVAVEAPVMADVADKRTLSASS
ncbi:hypothetical protein AMAG_01747 [Allomyces macrogynus ATCC 38327]|uniref:Uncharacterized protein n=1 Tax=Allomyces macrogynus (strain ATCC 38327) TaxID=578462 RepID=A0A0L0S0E8_ALLM3|nr:hypothetical protein AMAG_01747 [Allomyces macrogynus ATCC 38327]|eukprot:KNE55880.1 hypothetical protein AMAG_01747 [Allomyces macrogynus ATCC 38327]